MLSVNNIVQFVYNGKVRVVRLEKVTATYIQGWDATANHPEGGYRSFSIPQMEGCEVVGRLEV